MEFVYFGDDLSRRAPGLMGQLYCAQTNKWVTFPHVVGQIENRQLVTVRPASDTEIQRAEGIVALSQIWRQMNCKLAELLDHDYNAATAPGDHLVSVEGGQ